MIDLTYRLGPIDPSSKHQGTISFDRKVQIDRMDMRSIAMRRFVQATMTHIHIERAN